MLKRIEKNEKYEWREGKENSEFESIIAMTNGREIKPLYYEAWLTDLWLVVCLIVRRAQGVIKRGERTKDLVKAKVVSGSYVSRVAAGWRGHAINRRKAR